MTIKKPAIAIATVGVLLAATPVHAQSPSPTLRPLKELRLENRQEIKDMRSDAREEFKEAREDIRENVQEARQEIRSNVAERHAARLERRFGFYYERLTSLITKIETRIASLKSSGKDTASAESKLAEAKTTLASAKSLADQSVAAFKAIEPAKYDEQRAQALAARDLANKAREEFKKTLSLLKEVIKQLKALK